MPTPLRVLILEDNPSDTELLLYELKRGGFEPTALPACTEAEYLEALDRGPEIILADYNLPQFDALAALGLLKNRGQDIPFIVVSGSIGEEKAVEVVREGATDYLLKDRLGRLGPAIERALNEKRLRDRQQQTAQELADLNNQFRTLLNGIPDSLTLLTRELKVVWANQATRKMFQTGRKSIEGAHCYYMWHNGDKPCEQCPALETFRTGGTCDQTIHTGDGRTFGVKTFPLHDAAGRVTHVIHWASDITDKIRLREEADRAARLAALGELAAGIAHEINNPNGVILLNSSVLKDASIDAAPILEEHYRLHGDFQLAGLPYAEIRHDLPLMVAEVKDSAQRIKRIVDELKDFVRPGVAEPFRALDLNQAAQAGVRLCESTIKTTTRRFDTDYATDLPAVNGDMQRLVQVVVNLITNACQALRDAGQGISVTTSFDRERQLCLLRVSDEGRGIAAKDLPRLTEPFFTTRRQSGGTGLGLSVSARIVSEHGGRLIFESSAGHGAIVTLELPPCPKRRK